jgi:hypothetical protein
MQGISITKARATMVAFVLSLFTNMCIGQEISPLLVGNNLWYKTFNDTVWQLTKECGVKLIRIGGASYDHRMPSNDILLGWVKKIEGIGAEPLFQVSQYQTAEQAAELVKYFNIEKNGNKTPIKYWCIGNEPWLQAKRPATDTFGMVIEKYFKPISKAMKEVDSTILIFGPDECDYMDNYYNDLFGGKNDITGKIPGKSYYYCDGLSWHRYPQGNGDPATDGADDMLERIVKAKSKVDQVNKLHNRTGAYALQWGIGEYNSKGGPEVHTWGNGQMFGATLGWCMQYGATYAATWSMFEHGGDRLGSDFSFIDGTKMAPRSSYWHMYFVAKYFSGKFIEGKTNDTALLAYGAQDAGKISVMVLNRGYGPAIKYSINLNNKGAESNMAIINLAADKDIVYNDIIPERSTQVLVFQGDSILKVTYTNKDFDNFVPPFQTVIKKAMELPKSPVPNKTINTSYKATTLTWDDLASTETGYIIERKEKDNFEIVDVARPNSTSFTDAGLKPQSKYEYRIAAYNTEGQSAYSKSIFVTTLEVPKHLAFNGPHNLPGKIEAEDFDDNEEGIGYHDSNPTNTGGAYRMNCGVDIQQTADSGKGFNVGSINNGEWLTYTIANVKAGTYNVAVRAASLESKNISVDVILGDKLMVNIPLAATGGWQNWKTFGVKGIEISAKGQQTLKLKFIGNDINVNWIEISQ